MIDCDEAVRQLWAFLDDSIGVADRHAVEEHLAFCRRCCGEVEFAGELRALLASGTTEDIPADVLASLLSTLDDLEANP